MAEQRLDACRPGWKCPLVLLAVVALVVQVGCATGAPLRGGTLGGSHYRLLMPQGFKAPEPGSGGGVGECFVPVRGPDSGACLEADARERTRRVEDARAEALVQAAWREGRDPEEAREAEADRVLSQVVGLASGVDRVGAVLAFTFWTEEGALTLLGYQEEHGGARAKRLVDEGALPRVLRHVFGDYVGLRTGEMVLRLRREESRWVVDYDAARPSARPPEARMLAVRARGTPAETFLVFHEAAESWTHAVRVPTGGAARLALEVRLEDGRLVDWALKEVQRTREGKGGGSRPLSPEVTGHLVQVLLPFTEGVGSRTVHVVLRAEHGLGEAEARGRVESVRVVRPAQAPGPSWYLSMHEAILLRWREGVVEGSAWLAQRGVEELSLWLVGGIIAKGLGFFATEGLEWVTKALGREPEVVAGWLRTSLIRLSTEEQAAFEQLWRKVALEGEQVLSRSERKALRSLFVRLEQTIQQPLDNTLKKTFRKDARVYYAELYPQFAEVLERLSEKLPIHHRRPLQYAHLFPDENINAGENLAMLQEYVHKRINFLWGRFRQARPSPTSDEVRRAAEIIDRQFEPWYHHVDDPPGLLKTADEAREAALRELRSRFPGFE